MCAIDTATLKIIHYPDPLLRKVCKPVEVFDQALASLAERMLKMMHEANGIGLAGPQVGVLRRIFVCNITGDPQDDLVFINPELTDLEGEAEGEEGCLSIPDVTVNVRRALSCTLTARDLKGQAIEKSGTELAARCWQHECDHLNGRLITDRMSEADKIANRRSLKRLESEYRR
ncbi:MAG: peptide deformylase [Phycisphaerales bacterium]|nr:peptide deformylase [Phycisphaerales bacterium]